MSPQQAPIVLTPSPKAFFLHYTTGIMLSPLFLGLFILWKTDRKRRNTIYRITKNMLTIVQDNYSRNIDLVNIEDIKIVNQAFGIASIRIKTLSSGQTYSLIGLKEPAKIAKALNAS